MSTVALWFLPSLVTAAFRTAGDSSEYSAAPAWPRVRSSLSKTGQIFSFLPTVLVFEAFEILVTYPDPTLDLSPIFFHF